VVAVVVDEEQKEVGLEEEGDEEKENGK